MERPDISTLLRQTRILRAPRRMLSTFGATRIAYHLLSPVAEPQGKTRIRRGTVVSEKPLIVTADSFAERFKDFGESADEFAPWVSEAYKDLLRALEYNFRNEGFSTSMVSAVPADAVDRAIKELDASDERHGAIVACPDAGWSLALMKLTLEEAARSFPTHLRDLERRGLFDPDGKRRAALRREIEGLFAAAQGDPEAREALGLKLREHGLFEEYEDRFLGLF
ncbi:MAG: hypothetical protein HY927_02390 [Elusimicrobia bacterium]|nr:hypothetical protein [Elusimicrobiota bacterium]